jgi:lipopolysaccharide transport system permease protein
MLSAIRNDFRARFVRSKIAGLWVVINPLIQVAIFALILSNVLAAKLPGISSTYSYAIYLLAGMAIWGLFSEILNRCIGVFIENANTLKKIVFPRICLPIIVAGGAVFNFLIFMCAVCVVLVLTGLWPGIVILALIPVFFLVAAFALSLGLFLGTINVFMRDVAPVAQVVLQLWFWFTPIVYPISIIPEQYRNLMILNPMLAPVDSFHRVVLYGRAPLWGDLVPLLFLTVVLGLVCFVSFRRASAEMIDAL